MENFHLAELMVEERILKLELFRAYMKIAAVILISVLIFMCGLVTV